MLLGSTTNRRFVETTLQYNQIVSGLGEERGGNERQQLRREEREKVGMRRMRRKGLRGMAEYAGLKRKG
jgi:hypothetical protein